MVEDPPAFQSRGHGFDPRSGNQNPSCYEATKLMLRVQKSPHCNEDPVLQKKKKERKKREKEGECIVGQPLRKNSVIPQKVKHRIAIPVLSMCPRELKIHIQAKSSA